MLRTAQFILHGLLWAICCVIVLATLTPVAALIVGASAHVLGVGGSVILFTVGVLWLRSSNRDGGKQLTTLETRGGAMR